jgi:formamidopyrimidine-DNA glycosylase
MPEGDTIFRAARMLNDALAGGRVARFESVFSGMVFSVYGRGGRACRRCGAVIARRKAGDETRVTYWCPHCQERRVAANARTV